MLEVADATVRPGRVRPCSSGRLFARGPPVSSVEPHEVACFGEFDACQTKCEGASIVKLNGSGTTGTRTD